MDWNKIMYKLMAADDNAVIDHSELKVDGNVMVYVYKPDVKGCFHQRETIYSSLFQ